MGVGRVRKHALGAGLAVVLVTAFAHAADPLPPLASCPPELVLSYTNTLLVGGQQRVSYWTRGQGSYTAATLPADAQLLVVGQGRTVLLPMPAAGGELTIPKDFVAGQYQVGGVVEKGTRWFTKSPQATFTVQDSQPLSVTVVIRFPCNVDPHPSVLTTVTTFPTAANGYRNDYPAKLISTVRDTTTGITTVTYSAGGPAPLGTMQLRHSRATPVTVWEGPNYAQSDKCKQGNHTWPELRSRNTVAGMGSWQPAVDPAATKGAVTFAFPPVLDYESGATAEIARSPMPGSTCVSEP